MGRMCEQLNFWKDCVKLSYYRLKHKNGMIVEGERLVMVWIWPSESFPKMCLTFM